MKWSPSFCNKKGRSDFELKKDVPYLDPVAEQGNVNANFREKLTLL